MLMVGTFQKQRPAGAGSGVGSGKWGGMKKPANAGDVRTNGLPSLPKRRGQWRIGGSITNRLSSPRSKAGTSGALSARPTAGANKPTRKCAEREETTPKPPPPFKSYVAFFFLKKKKKKQNKSLHL